ncbi:hypothetical protein ALC53_13151, partial [Atta colombica]
LEKQDTVPDNAQSHVEHLTNPRTSDITQHERKKLYNSLSPYILYLQSLPAHKSEWLYRNSQVARHTAQLLKDTCLQKSYFPHRGNNPQLARNDVPRAPNQPLRFRRFRLYFDDV